MEGRERITLGSNNYLGLTTHPRVKQAARDALERLRHRPHGLAVHERHHAAAPGARARDRGLDGHRGRAGLHHRLPGQRGLHRHAARAGRHGDLRLGRPRLDPRRGDDVPRPHPPVPPQPARQAGEDARALRRATAAGCWWWWTACSRWRATWPRCPTWWRCAASTARACWWTRPTAWACSGATGTGACEAFGVADEVDLRMGTFSKSLASCGGFIAGPAEVIDFLRVQARAFMFTASAVPAAVGATLGALRVIRSDEGRELLARVLDNARYLQRGPGRAGLRRGAAHADARRLGRADPDHPGHDRRRLAGGAVLEGPLRRGRVRQRGALPGGAPRRGAAAHQRHGHPRARRTWIAPWRPSRRSARAWPTAH